MSTKQFDKLRQFMNTIDSTRTIKRWNGKFALDRSDVAQHSYRVAWWANFLMESLTPRMADKDYYKMYSQVIFYCLIHDVPEVFTNDVPHDIKRKYKELGDILGTIEKKELKEAYPSNCSVHSLRGLTDINFVEDDVKFVVKCADILDFLFEATNEVRTGNTTEEYKLAINRGVYMLQNYLKKTSSHDLMRDVIVKTIAIQEELFPKIIDTDLDINEINLPMREIN